MDVSGWSVNISAQNSTAHAPHVQQVKQFQRLVVIMVRYVASRGKGWGKWGEREVSVS